MAYNQDIQLLLQSRKKVDVKMSGRNNLLIIGVLFLTAVLSVGFYLKFLVGNLENEISTLNSDIAKLESKRDKSFESNIQIIKQQLSLIAGFVDSHIYWTIALEKLEGLLQNKVQVTSLNFSKLDKYDEVTFGGRTINYSTLAKQMAAFLSDNKIEDIELQGVETKSAGVVEFSMILKIKPSALHHEQ